MQRAITEAIDNTELQEALLLCWQMTEWVMNMLLLGAYAEIFDYVAYSWGECLKILFGDRVCC